MTQKTKRSIQWVKEKNQINYAGIHLFAEFWSGRIIEDPKEIKKILIEAAKQAQSVPLKIMIHKFQPRGITGVILLAKSHLSIHSWPEINYVAIDIFTCGQKTFPERALEYLKKKFKPKKVETKIIKRGKIR